MIASALLLGFCVLLGGASRSQEFRLLAVELAALPVLVLGLTALIQDGGRGHFWFLALTVAVVLLPLLQLTPLPPALWQALPGRDAVETARTLVGAMPTWTPISLTPDRTLSAWLALLPPIAMLIAGLTLRPDDQGRLISLVLAGCVLSLSLGLAQVATGGADWTYPWRWTHRGWMSGLFANRNHLATLCLVVLPFAVHRTVRGLGRIGSGSLDVWLGGALTGLLVVALGVIKSRAGVVIAGPVVLLSLVAAWRTRGPGRVNLAVVGLAAILGVAVLGVTTFALPPLLERFDQGASEEGRFKEWPTVFEAVQVYAPVGSGLGSFDAVHRSVEPLERLRPTYFNQAHNDYLEIWLEAGWLGLALIVVFLTWFATRTRNAWLAAREPGQGLGLAAAVAILAVLAASMVDYPLRTETIAVIFALCCVVLEGSGGASRIRRIERVATSGPRAVGG